MYHNAGSKSNLDPYRTSNLFVWLCLQFKCVTIQIEWCSCDYIPGEIDYLRDLSRTGVARTVTSAIGVTEARNMPRTT
jgi:hypothetical protein